MNQSNKNNNTPHLVPTALIGISACIAFLLLIFQSNVAIEYMKKGLKLCANTVIPSLFPFMVISEMIITSGLGEKIVKPLSKPFKALFGVSDGSACAFILGAVCGFPIGAKTLSTLLDQGEINESEASKALTFCNNPGSAFVINAVGISLFGSVKLGIILYISVILSSVAIGVMGRFFFPRKKTSASHKLIRQAEKNSVELFTSAISHSAISMLNVCALVAFFSSIIGCIGAITEYLGAPKQITAAIFGFFEISSGVSAAKILPFSTAIFLTALSLGWSGLSVHLQVMSVLANKKVSFKPYFSAKACQGILCAAICNILLKIFPLSEKTLAEITTHTPLQNTRSNAIFVCLVFLFASILPIFTDKMNQKSCNNPKRKFF